MSDAEQHVREHYDGGVTAAAVLDALAAGGVDPERPSVSDLWPLDQFHSRGHASTLELAELTGIARGDRVLDVGGGIGGPARTLAADLRCRVTVLDLTEAYCRIGEVLTQRTGLADLVDFRVGNALDLPFDDGSLDVVWTQHASMNIADKPTLYAEMRRVLRPGGRLAMHDIVAAPDEPPLHFPVPWAPVAEISFLQPASAVRSMIAGAGLRELAWRDVTAPSMDWFRERVAGASRGGPPPVVGLHLLLGRGIGTALATLLRNLEEGRVSVVMGVFEHP